MMSFHSIRWRRQLSGESFQVRAPEHVRGKKCHLRPIGDEHVMAKQCDVIWMRQNVTA